MLHDFYCQLCGKQVEEGSLVDVYSVPCVEEWCEACVDSQATWCERHERYEDVDVIDFENVFTLGGVWETWCKDAVEKDAFWCGHHQRWESGEDFENHEVWIDCDESQTWCSEAVEDNAYWCEGHERFESTDVSYNSVNDPEDGRFYGYFCNDYIEDNWDYFETCEDCGEIFYVAECCLEWDEYSEGRYCQSCWRDRSVVHGYSYKPTPNFTHGKGVLYHFEQPGALYLGVELELDEKNGGCSEVHSFATEVNGDSELMYAYCKDDGSLDRGVELVTHPLEAEYAVSEYPWGDVRSVALRNDLVSHDNDNCGLHVHVNRGFFGGSTEQELAAAKLMYLMERFEGEFVRFSRRRQHQLDSWCGICHSGIEHGDSLHKVHEKMKEYGIGARYRALNLNNRSTFEFRLWRGTIKVSTLRATLDFTQALCRFVKAASLYEIYDLDTFAELVYELEAYAYDFDNILRYCGERSL